MSSHHVQNKERLKGEIEHIKALDLNGLRLQWRNLFAKRAPMGLSKALLARALTYRVQADALGDLDPAVARVLAGHWARSANGAAQQGRDDGNRQSGSRVRSVLAIKPGSVLVREWRGCTHRVMALEVGFSWEGREYRSLSGTARAITGARWNGRRFFGLDRQCEGVLSETGRSVADMMPGAKKDRLAELPLAGNRRPARIAANLVSYHGSTTRERNSR